MARFNTVATPPKTTNLAGGQAYSQSPELELISILLTSFANDQFYRSADDTFTRLKELIKLCDPMVVAQAAVYARTQFGMRSITHVVASELAPLLSGKPWAKNFYSAVINRPDDMMEILSCHTGKIPNSMKRGFAAAFNRFNAYTLGKYRGEGKKFKLIDVVNLVHPKPTEQNKEALNALTKGKLVSTDTWESELTKAGQTATSDEEKAEFKKDVWVKLVKEKKIGYFALLRNLRNIIEQAPEITSDALEMLVNPEAIAKSLVLPFRFITAYEEIMKVASNPTLVKKVLTYLGKAIDISLINVPVFPGNTLVVLDVSGSMTSEVKGKTPAKIGALFSAALLKSNPEADFMTFDTQARFVNVDCSNSTLGITASIPFTGGGTDFNSIFFLLKTVYKSRKYDRVILLSDMQGWVGYHAPAQPFAAWKKISGSDPFVYSFDLAGYGTLQLPEKKVFCIAGFSEKIFDIMRLMEEDKQALLNTIKAVKL